MDNFWKYGGKDIFTRFTHWKTFILKEELSYTKELPYFRSICIHDHSIGFFIMVTPQSGDDIDMCQATVCIRFSVLGATDNTKSREMAISEDFKEFPDGVRLQPCG
ncbi:FkbH domain containing protein [Quillaja saponaria]|uniref:FkbH domain containing protein n=1 Tax=Quillaja saponaria TaxID=32244 RepID=A0AAD7LVI3_QUISA|nr:FkbH domain containing protein [Quillaja saponaria]